MKTYYQDIYMNSGGAEPEEINPEQLDSLLSGAADLLLKADSDAVEGNFFAGGFTGLFCREKDVFLALTEDPECGKYIETDDSFFIRSRGGKTEIIARRSGYPILLDGVLSVFNPCRLTGDKVHLFYILMPVRCGKNYLVDDFLISLSRPSKDKGMRHFTSAAVAELIDSGDVHTLTISLGVAADPGRTETVRIIEAAGKIPEGKADGSTDYYRHSLFREVKKDAVLAEFITGIAGKPGIDAFGNEIPVKSLDKIQFAAGPNVRIVEKEGGLIEYVSEVTGILDLSEASVAVAEELAISGDVCAETGGLDFSGNISVEGSVHSLYQIKCGGNLSIKGIIENGAGIECGGDFIAEKGVLGEKTKVLVKGNMETDYISEAAVRVLGDLCVHATIYSSVVFCGGLLTVEGKKVKNKNRGAVVGSDVTAMRGMKIHSAGSALSKTTLNCGIDNELKSKVQMMEKSVPVMKKKILRLQNKIGIDLSSPDVLERLKKLSEDKKERMKALLKDIKNYAARKTELEHKIKELETLVIAPDLSSLRIIVESHIIPDTVVRFGDRSLKVSREYGAAEILLTDQGVELKS